jgi:hypothetical protein
MITRADLADNSAAFAAAHWDALACAERDMATWDARFGRFVGAYINRAQMYERCAETLWLQAATGLPHCHCHLKPSRECPSSGMGLRLR